MSKEIKGKKNKKKKYIFDNSNCDLNTQSVSVIVKGRALASN